MAEQVTALALGSNLGDRAANLRCARDHIEKRLGPVLRASAVYETVPVGAPGQGPYLNQVVLVATERGPIEVLEQSLAIEAALGRRRLGRHTARTIDIDVLFCGDRLVDTVALHLPHPRLHERSFVLVPLAEILPDWRHPRLGGTAAELRDAVGTAGVRHWLPGGRAGGAPVRSTPDHEGIDAG